MAALTTDKLAAKLGVSTVRVWQIANARKVVPTDRGGCGKPALWPSTAVKALARRKPGRPKGVK